MSDVMVFASLATGTLLRLDGFDAQELANSAWAFAAATRPHVSLFAALARAAEQLLGCFTALGVTNLVWALASMSESKEQLFEMLTTAVTQQCTDDFDVEKLSRTLWSLCRRESLKAGWRLFDHANLRCASSDPSVLATTSYGRRAKRLA
eukprot:gnl/TRDRNA2_/TRDRNA2_99560_c1_seq1.p2 gnl/TRDRNA2_/TRDRNA2_99560_c1~~gnl/TRDRNA2_/TRDRNA2_99560_c1_seq1.p2  ORF type:complete len:150 (+),score=14.01 gnl/TRDRNA2_/TRDRNA2_99560_c1_seq1:143-592(+)